MNAKLAALGRWSTDHRRRVLAVWLLLLVVVGGLGLSLHGTLSSVFSVPGIESEQAQTLLQKQFPEVAGGTARVVFAAPAGTEITGPAAQAAISAGLRQAATVPGVVAVSDPASTGTVSPDRRIAYADVQFREPAQSVPDSARDRLTAAMAPARRAGLEVEYGGTAEALPVEPGGVGEVVGVVVAFVVLTVALSSLLAAGMPLLTALVGVGLGVIGVELVARWVELTNTAAVLATMLGLAVGIDYALFIIARHREQLADPGLGVRDSIGQAIATAGSAILFAGTTVIIALVSLSVAGIPFLTAMGLAAAATVLIAMLIAMTLVPAVLGFAGERLRPHGRRGHSPPGTWGRAWAKGISRAPIPVAVVGVAVLALLALPALHLRLGLPSNETQPAASTEHRGYDLLTEGFGPGFNATLAVVVDTRGVPSAQRGPVATALAGKLRADPGIAVVTAPIADPARSVAVISVVPKTGPDDDATSDLVHRLRDDDKAAATKAGAVVYVAGATATDLDVSTKLGHALPLFVAIIVVLALVLLTIAFRSLVVPITAALGFLLSVAAALGVVVWVFQDGHLDSVIGVAGAAPIVSFVPVLLIGVLFGLSMDYEVFLVSRMRESYDRDGDAAEAVAAGIEHSGRVVSAAALIMGSVFAGFVFTGDPIVKSIAFSLTVGVLIDAFVVRLTVIPAIMALLGARAWTVPGRF